MTSRGSELHDIRDSSFGSPEVYEELKPGLEYREGNEGDVAEGQHRLRPSPRKDIPQATLAERIHNARQGG
ncbi:MAG: hypothetical protein LC808_33985 [Actinobacteria bacterium]|nr:hypothetical protein [Actinomycetota bacterium]